MIKIINKETDVSIRILLYIINNNKKTTIKEISKILNISQKFIRKIIRLLSKNGLIKTKKGIGGGVFLAERTKQISLMDIIKIFQGGIKFLNCINNKGKGCSEIKTCKLRKKLLKLEKRIAIEFNNTYLIDLF